jgi:hypothetical protein
MTYENFQFLIDDAWLVRGIVFGSLIQYNVLILKKENIIMFLTFGFI